MFDSIITSVVGWLLSANVNAVKKFPESKLDREESTVAVSIKSGVMTSTGAGNYLGIYETDGAFCEVYGSRAELSFALDIYTPDNSSSEVFDGIANAVCDLPDGLKFKSLECGAPEFDEACGMFCRKCSLNCTAIMVRTENEERTAFSDFVLRGELKAYER